MTGRTGVRGGHNPPLSLKEVDELFSTWRQKEYGFVRAHILLTAAEAGEFHADDIASLKLNQPNVIGAAVNALSRGGLLEKLNKNGEVEHRKGHSLAAHGRLSYVWRATEQGKVVARKLWHQRRNHEGFFAAEKGPEQLAIVPSKRPTLLDWDAA